MEMSLEDVVYSKINSNGSIFRIKTVWNSECLCITLLENFNIWSGLLTKEELNIYAEAQNMSCTNYLDNLKLYLTEESADIELMLIDNKLVVYKNMKLRIKYFCVILNKEECNESIVKLLDDLNEKNVLLQNKLLRLKEENLNTVKEKEESDKKLAEFKNEKEKWEKQLYGSFILLLNEKKKRIQLLTETLESYKNGISGMDDTRSKNGNNFQTNTTSSGKREEISESESDYETDNNSNSDTDESASTSIVCTETVPVEIPSPKTLPKRIRSSTNLDVVESKRRRENEENTVTTETISKQQFEEATQTYKADTQDIINKF